MFLVRKRYYTPCRDVANRRSIITVTAWRDGTISVSVPPGELANLEAAQMQEFIASCQRALNMSLRTVAQGK